VRDRIKNIICSMTGKNSGWKRKAFETLVLITCLALVLTTISYSWIRRKWTPNISQNNMQIMSGDLLIFSLIGSNNPQAALQDALSLNALLGLTDFVFKPVSNFSGNSDDFFTVNTSKMFDEYFVHLMQGEVITDEGWTLLGKNNGYIEFSFILQGKDIIGMNSDAYTKYVYLSTNTKITYTSDDTDEQKAAVNAMRVSITIGDDTDHTYVFVPSSSITHKAISNLTNTTSGTKKWNVDGTRYRAATGETGAVIDASGILRRMLINPNGNAASQTNQVVLTNSSANVSPFSAYMGGFSLVNNQNVGSFDSNATLFSMNPGDTRKITLRIWLEGEDDDCTIDIKRSKIDFYLGFESYNVQNGGIVDPPTGDSTENETSLDAETTKKKSDD